MFSFQLNFGCCITPTYLALEYKKHNYWMFGCEGLQDGILVLVVQNLSSAKRARAIIFRANI